MKFICSVSLIVFIFCTPQVFAISLGKSTDLISNLSIQLKKASETVDEKINFPQLLPRLEKGKYFISIETNSSDYEYQINFDRTKNCKGVKTCNLGLLTVIKAGNPQIYYDMLNHEITKIVYLKDKQKAYFTPAHPMADYWPTLLEWRVKNKLYRLSWVLPQKDEKELIMGIANSTE